eukprot:Opistho-2@13118
MRRRILYVGVASAEGTELLQTIRHSVREWDDAVAANHRTTAEIAAVTVSLSASSSRGFSVRSSGWSSSPAAQAVEEALDSFCDYDGDATTTPGLTQTHAEAHAVIARLDSALADAIAQLTNKACMEADHTGDRGNAPAVGNVSAIGVAGGKCSPPPISTALDVEWLWCGTPYAPESLPLCFALLHSLLAVSWLRPPVFFRMRLLSPVAGDNRKEECDRDGGSLFDSTRGAACTNEGAVSTTWMDLLCVHGVQSAPTTGSDIAWRGLMLSWAEEGHVPAGIIGGIECAWGNGADDGNIRGLSPSLAFSTCILPLRTIPASHVPMAVVGVDVGHLEMTLEAASPVCLFLDSVLSIPASTARCDAMGVKTERRGLLSRFVTVSETAERARNATGNATAKDGALALSDSFLFIESCSDIGVTGSASAQGGVDPPGCRYFRATVLDASAARVTDLLLLSCGLVGSQSLSRPTPAPTNFGRLRSLMASLLASPFLGERQRQLARSTRREELRLARKVTSAASVEPAAVGGRDARHLSSALSFGSSHSVGGTGAGLLTARSGSAALDAGSVAGATAGGVQGVSRAGGVRGRSRQARLLSTVKRLGALPGNGSGRFSDAGNDDVWYGADAGDGNGSDAGRVAGTRARGDGSHTWGPPSQSAPTVVLGSLNPRSEGDAVRRGRWTSQLGSRGDAPAALRSVAPSGGVGRHSIRASGADDDILMGLADDADDDDIMDDDSFLGDDAASVAASGRTALRGRTGGKSAALVASERTADGLCVQWVAQHVTGDVSPAVQATVLRLLRRMTRAAIESVHSGPIEMDQPSISAIIESLWPAVVRLHRV